MLILHLYIHELPTKYPHKKIGRTKYTQRKISDPRNTHEKKIKNLTIHWRKDLGPTIYPQGETLDSRNTPLKKILNPQRYEPAIAR